VVTVVKYRRPPRNQASVNRAEGKMEEMLGNMGDHIGRTRNQIAASVDSVMRDKGHLLVDAAAAIEQKRVNFWRNNTGANLQAEYGPFPDTAQGTVSRVRQLATNALTSEPAQKIRNYLSIDPAGENVDRTQLNIARAVSYGLPISGAGVALLGTINMYGGSGDQQTSGQISMSEEERKKKEDETLGWAAAAAGTGLLAAGGGGYAVGAFDRDSINQRLQQIQYLSDFQLLC